MARESATRARLRRAREARDELPQRVVSCGLQGGLTRLPVAAVWRRSQLRLRPPLPATTHRDCSRRVSHRRRQRLLQHLRPDACRSSWPRARRARLPLVLLLLLLLLLPRLPPLPSTLCTPPHPPRRDPRTIRLLRRRHRGQAPRWSPRAPPRPLVGRGLFRRCQPLAALGA